jgi:gas vesicle protein
MTRQYDTTDSHNSAAHQTNVLLALLAGASAGLVAGILMAPKPGDKLRAEIGQAVNGYLDAARESADKAVGKARAKLSDAVDTGAKSAHSAIDQTVAAVQTGARQGHEAVDTAAGTIRTRTGA